VGLSLDGAIYTWGNGTNHRLGYESQVFVKRPKKLTSIPEPVVDISVGSQHSVAVTENGLVSRLQTSTF